MERRSFQAMGTTIELVLETNDSCAAAAAFDEAEAEFERLEQIMSRFRPDSELSQLNGRGALDASQELAEIITTAVEARESTDGRFDPTILDALVAAGYDRSFDELSADDDAPTAAPSRACGGGIEIDGRRIVLAPGVRVDLGGIGKGFAAERVAAQLALTGPALVSAGGDVAVRGIPAEGSWAVAVDDSLTLGLERGGLATSGRDRRRWERAGLEQHHLIDPTTGLPSRTDLIRVTAIAADAVQAEVIAKTLFLSGSKEAIAANRPAVLVTDDGRTLTTGGL